MKPRDLIPDELLSTTRAVRKRLDLTRPVERELIEECIGLAFPTPTPGRLGAQSQGFGQLHPRPRSLSG
jgi:hypothetical protein